MPLYVLLFVPFLALIIYMLDVFPSIVIPLTEQMFSNIFSGVKSIGKIPQLLPLLLKLLHFSLIF